MYVNKAVTLGCRLPHYDSIHLLYLHLAKFIDADLYSPQAFPEKSNTGHVLLL